MTFKEAYLRTGRILNVSVIPADRHSCVTYQPSIVTILIGYAQTHKVVELPDCTGHRDLECTLGFCCRSRHSQPRGPHAEAEGRVARPLALGKQVQGWLVEGGYSYSSSEPLLQRYVPVSASLPSVLTGLQSHILSSPKSIHMCTYSSSLPAVPQASQWLLGTQKV